MGLEGGRTGARGDGEGDVMRLWCGLFLQYPGIRPMSLLFSLLIIEQMIMNRCISHAKTCLLYS